jgi:hypothetical protein
VTSPTSFTYLDADPDQVATGGTVTLNWPVPDTGTPNYYQVVAAPTATTFTVQVAYSNGTWSSGLVQFAWNGTFFVTGVPSPTSVQYQQYGPDATTSSVGTVTPYGQIAPGKHQMQVMFLTRQGYLTKGSPAISFVADGGQYLTVSDLPIGPSNVVARVLAFTGALGSYFFYIPVPAEINGILVSTATQVNDNTSTSVVLDFADNTLYAALGVSIQGNNVANQIVLDSALGFIMYDSRLAAYGYRNRINNLLNMSFDGGYLPSVPTVPAGWTLTSGGGVLTAGHFGLGWQITAIGRIQQGFYEDSNAVPIGTPNTPYRFRAWVQGVGTVTATLSSASTGFSSTAVLASAAISSWKEAAFSLPTPSSIPGDMLFSVQGTGTVLLDEMSVIYAANPYQDLILQASYIDNPEAFDALSGIFGPKEDTRKIMGAATVRGNLYLLTQDPGGRLHETSANGVTEPSGWVVNEVGANCGALSTFGIAVSQADDKTAGGGEEWLAWASQAGARIFGGDQPWKISQEIEPNWAGNANRGYKGLNWAAATTIWALNDPNDRALYFGVPSLDVAAAPTAPNQILVMSYRQLETASAIGNSPPVHNSIGGKLITTDHTRKWCPWNLKMNGGALMYRTSKKLEPVFFGGSGLAPGSGVAYSNAYSLDETVLTDNDYGLIVPIYITYAFVGYEQETALQLGAHRKQLAYVSAQVSGVGNITVTVLCNTFSNPWHLNCVRLLALDPKFDLEWGGGSAVAQRMFIKFASSPIAPLSSLNNSFSLQKVVAALRPAAHLPVRGAAK